MTWKHQVLVVANVTANSPELGNTLKLRGERASTSFSLIVPATRFEGGRAAAIQRVREAVASLRALGLDVHGSVADGDPVVAVAEAWSPAQYDEIIISTLPVACSRWLRADLPRRIEKLTGALVTHVVAKPQNVKASAPRPAVRAATPPSVSCL